VTRRWHVRGGEALARELRRAAGVPDYKNMHKADLSPDVPGFRCIVADPPWNERGAGRYHRGADKHYPLMTSEAIVEAILRAPVWQPAPSCHLWLWVTNNFLADGLFVMRALGFRYVTNLAWVKRSFGLGHYLRGQHELCLFGARGPAMAPLYRDNSSVISVEKAAHSVKPEQFFSVVERVSPGPRLEMFARVHRPGWECWGNDVDTNLFSESSA
jgi:N6-adenosine-specific RNA methylase IME4